MQLMWAASPLGKMHCVSIRTRRVACGIAVLAAMFVIAGIAASVFAFKIAVDTAPQLVAHMGGIMTAAEFKQRESEYRKKLAELYQEVATAHAQLGQLHALKEEFARLALPKGHRAAGGAGRAKPGQGGPALSVTGDDAYLFAETMSEDIVAARERLQRLNTSLNRARDEWHHELLKMEHLPTAVPLPHNDFISSGYGVRKDPFTHALSRHEGVDLSAPAGTPILASASGTVARVVRDPQYGNMVDIDHGNGYSTRYAHAQAILVRPGDKLQRGSTIGTVGSTGRSTAPHLHYEIRLHNKPLNPNHYRVALD
jgi:murein DD-endopeptidase MepM/ murein hydrolase activator NlpD